MHCFYKSSDSALNNFSDVTQSKLLLGQQHLACNRETFRFVCMSRTIQMRDTVAADSGWPSHQKFKTSANIDFSIFADEGKEIVLRVTKTDRYYWMCTTR